MSQTILALVTLSLELVMGFVCSVKVRSHPFFPTHPEQRLHPNRPES
ncbi:MAG: hypothetical protein AAFY78_09140 [Cyanobacteria bacterium J06648_16]